MNYTVTKMIYSGIFLLIVALIAIDICVIFFVFKYWLVAKRVTLVATASEDEWLMFKAIGLLTLLSFFFIADGIA